MASKKAMKVGDTGLFCFYPHPVALLFNRRKDDIFPIPGPTEKMLIEILIPQDDEREVGMAFWKR